MKHDEFDLMAELEDDRQRCHEELRYAIDMQADAAAYLATSGNMLESYVNRHSHYSKRVRKFALAIRELEADIQQALSDRPQPTSWHADDCLRGEGRSYCFCEPF